MTSPVEQKQFQLDLQHLCDATKNGVNDGARTHDNRNHNPGLYQLSYAHHKTNSTL